MVCRPYLGFGMIFVACVCTPLVRRAIICRPNRLWLMLVAALVRARTPRFQPRSLVCMNNPSAQWTARHTILCDSAFPRCRIRREILEWVATRASASGNTTSGRMFRHAVAAGGHGETFEAHSTLGEKFAVAPISESAWLQHFRGTVHRQVPP